MLIYANWLLYPTLLLLITTNVHAQERHNGMAVVRVNDREYTIPIECNDSSGPERGFINPATIYIVAGLTTLHYLNALSTAA